MKVSILIIDDEQINIAPDLFHGNFAVKGAPREFDYSLHPDFGSVEEKNVSIKKLTFTTDADADISFEKVKEIVDAGCAEDGSYWLIYLDMNWGVAGDPCCKWNEVHEAFPAVDAYNYMGWQFAQYIMSKENWRGLVCVATGNTNPKNAPLNNIIRNHEDDRHLDTIAGEIRADASRFLEGLNLFESYFGSNGLMKLWLNPPSGQNTWFKASSEYHNPGVAELSGKQCQYKNLTLFFGSSDNWEKEQGKFTKNLFEVVFCNNEPVLKCDDKTIIAGMIPLLFRNSIVLEGLDPNREIRIPVQPGLPFLFAVKQALEKAREENAESNVALKGSPLLLKEVGNQIAIVLKQSKDAEGLVSKVSDGDDGDGVSGAIYRALRANVIPPHGLEDKEGCNVFGPTDRPVAEVKWVEDASELQILWPL